MPVIEIDNFRKKYPDYNDIDDMTLASKLAEKYPDSYGDLPQKVGMSKSVVMLKPKEKIGTNVYSPDFLKPIKENFDNDLYKKTKNALSIAATHDIAPDLAMDITEEYIKQVNEPNLYEKAVGSFKAGYGDIYSSIGGYLKRKGIAPTIADFYLDWGDKLKHAYIPPSDQSEFTWRKMLDPEWYATTAIRSVPFGLSLVPAAVVGAYGGAAAAGAAGLGAFGTTVCGAIGGAALTRPLESAFEGQGAYDEAIEKGISPEEAEAAADQVFWNNMKLTGLDAAKFTISFLPMGKVAGATGKRILNKRILSAVGKLSTVGLMEAAEERYQEKAVMDALNDSVSFFDMGNSRLNEASAAGAVFGVGLAGTGSVFTALKNKVTQTMPQPVKQIYEQAKEKGMSDIEALDAVAETPEGKQHIEDVVTELKDLVEGKEPKKTVEQIISETQTDESDFETRFNRLIESEDEITDETLSQLLSDEVLGEDMANLSGEAIQTQQEAKQPWENEMYHGGNLGGEYKRGISFTPEVDVALGYADRIADRSVTSANLNIKNPLIIESSEYLKKANELGAKSKSANDFFDIDTKMQKYAKDNGHDAIVQIDKKGELNEVVVFDKSQIVNPQIIEKGGATNTPLVKFVEQEIIKGATEQRAIDYHRRQIKQALSEGKSVPPEVLKDYPELLNEYQTEKVNLLKSQKGELDLTPLVDLGRSVWLEGKQTFEQFYARIKEIAGDVWDKVKDYVKQAWDVLANERGSISTKPKTLYDAVKKAGGIDPEYIKEYYNWKEDIQQYGLVNLTKKGGRALDDLATELQSQGILDLTPDEYAGPGDYLLSELKRESETVKKKGTEFQGLTAEEKAAIKELEDQWRSEGATEDEIKEVRIAAQEIFDDKAAKKRGAKTTSQSDLLQKRIAQLRSVIPTSKVKSVIRETTGQVRTEQQITETTALKAGMKKAEQAGKAGFKAGITEGIRQATTPKPDTMKQAANKFAGVTKLADFVREDKALQAAFTKAAQNARIAFREGNKAGIQKQKDIMKELLAKAQQRLAEKEQEERDIATIKRLAEMKGDIAVDYQKKIKELMTGFDFKNITAQKWKELQGLKDYIDREGVPLGIKPKRIAELSRLTDINVKDLTPEQIGGLKEQLKTLTQLGKLKANLKYKYKAREHARILNEIKETTNNLDPVVKQGEDRFRDRLKVAGINFYLDTLHAPRVADMADQFKDYKGVQAKLIRSTGEAETEAVSTSMQRGLDFLDFLNKEGIEVIPEESESDIRMNIVMRYREGARTQAQTLMDHYGIKELPTLTPTEEKIVGYIQKDMEANKGKLAATWEEVENEIFPEQEVYYLPLKYAKEEEIVPELQTEGRGRTTHTFDGFSHARRPGVKKLPRVGVLQIYQEAVLEQEWYTQIQPVIADIKSVVLTDDYKESAGEVLYNWWKDHLDILSRRGWSASAQLNTLSTLMRSVRHNVNTAILAFKASTVIMQPFAVFDGMAYVNAKYGARAAGKVLTETTKNFTIPGTTKEIVERSDALQQRQGGELAITEEMKRAKGEGIKDKLTRLGFRIISQADVKTAAGTQEAIKKILMDEGVNETEAQKEAEFVMHMSQGSSSIAYRPHILARGEGARTWFTFQTFIMNRWGIIAHDLVAGNIVKGEFTKKMSGLISIGILMLAGYSEDEARKWLYNATHKKDIKDDKRSLAEIVLVDLASTMPFFGNIISAASENRDAYPPAMKTLVTGGQGVGQAVKGKTAESKAKGVMKVIETVLTLALGYPGTAQFFDLLEGALIKEKPKRR